ncbi:hypothetical protein K432DRAFT_409088 [Lepidopterella palustris CBS 459.81]|uniref:Uncharacterized protein n=1 Tax=Lepidopterella palustris CBS 459.81 TaxID=1314670 RepID=A0A8E2E0Y2_9PEZI|nr:hypothetical protein K432DRAFT_409088 [Lepidopterella palustris CBS 459.81]
MGYLASKTVRGATKKAKWAIVVAEKVRKLRALVSAKVIIVNLQLAAHASETLSRTESASSEQHDQLLQELEEQRIGMAGLASLVEEIRSAAIISREIFTGEICKSKSETTAKLENNIGRHNEH